MSLISFAEDRWFFFIGTGLTLLTDLAVCIYTGTQVYLGRGLDPFTLGGVISVRVLN